MRARPSGPVHADSASSAVPAQPAAAAATIQLRHTVRSHAVCVVVHRPLVSTSVRLWGQVCSDCRSADRQYPLRCGHGEGRQCGGAERADCLHCAHFTVRHRQPVAMEALRSFRDSEGCVPTAVLLESNRLSHCAGRRCPYSVLSTHVVSDDAVAISRAISDWTDGQVRMRAPRGEEVSSARTAAGPSAPYRHHGRHRLRGAILQPVHCPC